MKRLFRFVLWVGFSFIAAVVLGAEFESVLLTFALLVLGTAFAVRRCRARRSMVPTREQWRAHLRKMGIIPFDTRAKPVKWPVPSGMLW